MNEYDSTNDTLVHISILGGNIDKLCDILSKPSSRYAKGDGTLIELARNFCIKEVQDEMIERIIFNSIDSHLFEQYAIVDELQVRKQVHDKSKLMEPEKKYFDIWTPKLKSCVYGSEEYFAFLQELKIPLEHHYSIYRHHPQHFPDGINNMNIVDIIEMFCDWGASIKRYDNSDIHDGIEINRRRFGCSRALTKVFHTTNKYFE